MANFFKNLRMAFNITHLEQQLDVKVRLIDKTTKEPIGGEGYSVRFYDKDELDNDFLGEGPLDENGVADIRFDPAAMIDGAEDGGEEREREPDLYFELVKDGKVIFTSEVWEDVDYERMASFSVREGKEMDFGTFLIDLSKP